MENYTNEKSLMVINDNFITKIKNFFSRIFYSRRNDYYEEEQNDNEVIQEEPIQKTRKLFNYDAEDNWPEKEGDGTMNNEDENNMVNTNDNDGENNEIEREELSQAYIEKQEIEQKLMNYYASIKDSITPRE